MPLNFYSPPAPAQQSIFTPGNFILCTVVLAAAIVTVVSQMSDDEDNHSFMFDSFVDHLNDNRSEDDSYAIDFNYWKL